MFRKLLPAIFILFFSFALKAQSMFNLNWANSIGKTGYEASGDIVTDAQKNSYVVGNIDDTIDFDPGAGIANLSPPHDDPNISSAFVAKYDSSGNFIWVKGFFPANNTSYSSSYHMAISGNTLAIEVVFGGTVDMDPTSGTNLFTSNGYDACLISMDLNGNVNWASQLRSVSSVNTILVVAGLAVNSTGQVFIAASLQGTYDMDPSGVTQNYTASIANYEDILVAKYNNNGSFGFCSQFKYSSGTSTGYQPAVAMTIDNSSNVYVTGYFGGTMDFDPGPGNYNLTTGGYTEFYIAKVTNTGAFGFAYKGNSPGTSSGSGGYSIVVLNNSIYLSGSYRGTVDVDLTAGVNNIVGPAGSNSPFIAKYSMSGALSFIRLFPTPNSEIFKTLKYSNGNLFAGGDLYDSLDIDPGPGNYMLVRNGGSGNDYMIARYDTLGNFSSGFETGNTGTQFLANIAPVGNKLFVSGYFDGAMDVDPSPAISNLTPNGSYDFSLLCYSVCPGVPSQPGTISGPVQLCNSTTNTYSVTPVAGAVSYTWILPAGWSGTSTGNSINTTASSTSGTISVTASNGCGSSVTQTLPVAVSSITTTASSTNVLCNGSCNGTATGNPTGGTVPYTYLWSPPGATSLNATNLCAGNYTFTVTDNLGCSATASVVITQPASIPGNAVALPNAVCAGSCSNLDISPSPGSGCSFSWAPASGLNSTTVSNPVACPTVTTTYTCTITDTGGCTKTTTVTVTVFPPPSLFVSGGGNVCAGTDLCFTMNGGFSGYSWSGPCGFISTMQNPCINSIQNSCGGTYSVAVVDIHGCTNTTTVSALVNALPTVTYNETQTITCVNWSPVTLSAGFPAGGSYSGTAVSGNTFAPATAGAGTFNIVYTYINGNGCTNSDTSQIIVDLCSGIQTVSENSGFDIFPNPFHNAITVNCNNLDETATVELFNVLGEVVLTRQITSLSTEIEIPNLESGIYFIKFTSGENSMTKKIVRE
jgi:hypothetical protein